MIRKCQWCNEIMGEKPPLDDTRITHGICPLCREVVLGEIQPINLTGDIFGQMVAITNEHAERIMNQPPSGREEGE